MNIKTNYDILERRKKELEKDVEELNNKFEIAKTKTEEFLNSCTEHGIKVVSIGTETDLIKSSKKFPFNHSGSIFADEEFNGWPAIWRVGEKTGVGDGCGNSGQHQSNNENLIEGVYALRDGKWYFLIEREYKKQD